MSKEKKYENIQMVKEIEELTDDWKRYYAEVSQEILSLIQQGKIQDAIDIIDKEIEAVYIPNTILITLVETRNELEMQLKNIEYEKSIQNMTPLQMWDKIYNPKKGTFDSVFYSILLHKKEDKLDDTDYSIIAKIFKDKKIKNTSKVALAMGLLPIDTNKTFEIYNNDLNKTFKVDFSNKDNLNMPSQTLIKKLDDAFMKEPSKFQLALNFIQLLYSWFFPTKIPFKDEDIVSSIQNIIGNFFGDEKLKDNDIINIITTILHRGE